MVKGALRGFFLLLCIWGVAILPFTEASGRRGRTKSLEKRSLSNPEALDPSGLRNGGNNYCPFNAVIQALVHLPGVLQTMLTSISEATTSPHQAALVELMGQLRERTETRFIKDRFIPAFISHNERIGFKFNVGSREDAHTFVQWVFEFVFPPATYDLFKVTMKEEGKFRGLVYFSSLGHTHTFSIKMAPEHRKQRLADIPDYNLEAHLNAQLHEVQKINNIKVEPSDEYLDSFDKKLSEFSRLGINMGLPRNTVERTTIRTPSGPLLAVRIDRAAELHDPSEAEGRLPKLIYKEKMRVGGHNWVLNSVIVYLSEFHYYTISRTGFADERKKDPWHNLDDSAVTPSLVKDALECHEEALWLFYVREDALEQWRQEALRGGAHYKPAIPAWLHAYVERSMTMPVGSSEPKKGGKAKPELAKPKRTFEVFDEEDSELISGDDDLMKAIELSLMETKRAAERASKLSTEGEQRKRSGEGRSKQVTKVPVERLGEKGKHGKTITESPKEPTGGKRGPTAPTIVGKGKGEEEDPRAPSTRRKKESKTTDRKASTASPPFTPPVAEEKGRGRSVKPPEKPKDTPTQKPATKSEGVPREGSEKKKMPKAVSPEEPTPQKSATKEKTPRKDAASQGATTKKRQLAEKENASGTLVPHRKSSRAADESGSKAAPLKGPIVRKAVVDGVPESASFTKALKPKKNIIPTPSTDAASRRAAFVRPGPTKGSSIGLGDRTELERKMRAAARSKTIYRHLSSSSEETPPK